MEDSISLGDVFQRVALSIRKDLMDVLTLTAKSDPEINTMAMSRFCTRTRRKVLQLLAAIRWLSTPRTQRILDALNTYYFNLQDFEHRCNTATAEMHFLHSRIYSMRSPVPLVKESFDLMKASKVAGSLPAGVFLCGRKQFPAIDPTFPKELNLTIRMKLFHENSKDIIKGSLKGSLKDGILSIQYSDLFSVACTTNVNCCDAPWKLLQYSIFAPSGLRKYFDRRNEYVAEFMSLMKDCNVASLKELTGKCYQNAILNRLSDIPNIFSENRKGLQPVQVIQDLRKGNYAHVVVFGFWKSDFSRQYQFHYIAAVDNSSEINDSQLTFYVKTVQSEEYNVDYTTANLREISCVAPNSEALRDLFVKGAATSEITKEFILSVVELKLMYLLKRLPVFPSSMNILFELNGQSLIMYSGLFSIVLQLDSITGRFYFNVASSTEKEPLHGNLERFLLEINSVEMERDFSAYFLSQLSQSNESFSFRPLTTVDLVVAYLKTMDLDATLIATHCRGVSSQEDRSLRFQYLLHNLFAKFWRRKFWLCEQTSVSMEEDHDTATVSTGGGTHASMKLQQHRLHKKAGKVLFMLYYGYLIRPDFTVGLVVAMRKIYLDKKRPMILDVEQIDSIEKELVFETSQVSEKIQASDIAMHTWETLESQLWTKIEQQHILRSVSIPSVIGLPLKQTVYPVALQAVFDDLSCFYQSKNILLWPLRSEGKELTIAVAGSKTGIIDVSFSSASTTAQLLHTSYESIKTCHLQELLKNQTGIYASSKVFASLSLQVCQERKFSLSLGNETISSLSNITYQYKLEQLHLFHHYMDNDDPLRGRKRQQAEHFINDALRMILQHYSVPAAEIVGLFRLENIRPMVLTMRAVILFISVCLMDIQQVKAHWSFAKHALQLLNVVIAEDSLTIVFRWNKVNETNDDVDQIKPLKKSELVLGYLSASLQLPVDRQEMPSMTFVDLRHNRTLILNVEDLSLVNIADFFNMDRFDDN